MTFRTSPFRLSPAAPSPFTGCVNPTDSITLLCEYRKRMAHAEAIKQRRMQRIDWYLTDRASRAR